MYITPSKSVQEYSENIHNPERNQHLKALVMQKSSPNEILYYVIFDDYIEVLQYETSTEIPKHIETVELFEQGKGSFIPEHGTYETIKHQAAEGGIMDIIYEIIKAKNSLENLRGKYPNPAPHNNNRPT